MEDFKDFVLEMGQEQEFEYYVYRIDGGRMPEWLWRVRNLFSIARVFILAKRCEIRGHHNLVDDGSWHGPDSGGEAFRCVDCGQSWRHIFY